MYKENAKTHTQLGEHKAKIYTNAEKSLRKTRA